MKSKPILESIEFMILLICDSVSNCFYFFFTLKSTSSQIEAKPETKPILEFIKFLNSFCQIIKISFMKIEKIEKYSVKHSKKYWSKPKKSVQPQTDVVVYGGGGAGAGAGARYLHSR